MSDILVLKISGHELDDADYLARLGRVVASQFRSAVIVHGGGKEISELQTRLGITPQYVDGIRVTDAASLQVVEMVLAGTVNKRLVRVLTEAGMDACGLSGVDRAFIRAVPLAREGYEMGFTGSVQQVRGEVLMDLLAGGVTPVVAPVCYGPDHSFNVNADSVAGAIAGALDAGRLVFLSNVPGVLVDGTVRPELTAADVDRLIASGVISGGMVPKVRAALQALQDGARQCEITDLHGLEAGSGTVFRAGT